MVLVVAAVVTVGSLVEQEHQVKDLLEEIVLIQELALTADLVVAELVVLVKLLSQKTLTLLMVTVVLEQMFMHHGSTLLG
jgi:hypothetical protein